MPRSVCRGIDFDEKLCDGCASTASVAAACLSSKQDEMREVRESVTFWATVFVVFGTYLRSLCDAPFFCTSLF
jgi:hypothetical protein